MKSSPNSLVGTKAFNFEFAIGDRVIVDKDDRLEFTVIGIQVNPEGVVYKLSWFSDGRHVAEWFDAFRIFIASQSTR